LHTCLHNRISSNPEGGCCMFSSFYPATRLHGVTTWKITIWNKKIPEVLKPANIKIIALWAVITCSVLDRYQCFGKTFSLRWQKQMKVGDSSAMSVPTYYTTGHHIPEDCQDMKFTTTGTIFQHCSLLDNTPSWSISRYYRNNS
jgi:hypothetical protein